MTTETDVKRVALGVEAAHLATHIKSEIGRLERAQRSVTSGESARKVFSDLGLTLLSPSATKDSLQRLRAALTKLDGVQKALARSVKND